MDICNVLGDPVVTANLYCNFAYPYWEGCVICSIYFWVTQYIPFSPLPTVVAYLPFTRKICLGKNVCQEMTIRRRRLRSIIGFVYDEMIMINMVLKVV